MAQSIEVLTVSTSSSPGYSMTSVVPLQVELTKYPIVSRDEGNKLRRPVRPIDRQRMRPWLMELLDLGNVFGLRWTNRHQGVFQISWRHASRLGWNLETDGDVFERWARHTGIYKEGDPPEPKRWKANFRCALHSLHDVVELTNAVERRGRNACRTYRFLQSSDEQSGKKRKAKAIRTREINRHSQQQKCLKEIVPMILESGSSEDVVSDTESEASHQDKVIVQTIDMKDAIPGEEFCLHHDHDYAGPDKTKKTIVLRQGVGSIMFHKEVQNAPDAADEVESLLMSNLDQLASAAMNSACIDSLHSQEVACDYAVGTTCRTLESLLEMPQMSQPGDSDLTTPTVSLRDLLMERNVHGVHAVNYEKSTRKRKSLALAGDSFMVNLETASENEAAALSGNIKTPICFCSNEKMKCQSSKDQSSPTSQRSGSPKILCRRSKRNRARNDKCTSEPSEPLMSSCLLLLEAATRLDIAEKTRMPSLSCKAKMEKQNMKHFPESSFKTKTNTHAEMVHQSSGLKYESPTDSNSHLTSFGILRTTLENANKVTDNGDNLPKSKAITNLLKESSKAANVKVISSESEMIAPEAPFITGLFSGVQIQSRSPFSLSYNKLEDNVGSMWSKGKLFVYEEVAMNNELATASKGDKESNQTVSEALLSCATLPAVKSLKRKITSQCDAPVLVAHTISSSGQSPQTYVSSRSSSLESTSQIESANQKSLVWTSESKSSQEEFQILPLSASAETACIIVKEQPFQPLHKMDKIHVVNKSNISVLGSQNICISTSPNIENHTTEPLQISVSSVTSSPAQRTVTITTSSCLPAISFAPGITPLRILPIYSQAEMAVSAKSEIPVCLHSKDQSVIPLKSSSIIPSNNVWALSPPISTDTRLMAMQEKDVFISDPEKKVTNEVELHVLPLTSSYSFVEVPTDNEKTTSANVHVATKSQAVPEPVIPDEYNKTQLQLSLSSSLPSKSEMRTVSVLPKPYQLTSANNNADSFEVVKPSAPVIINGRIFSVGSVALSDIIKPETLDQVPSLEEKDILCDLIVKVAHGNNPVDLPSVISSNFTAQETETTTHSDIMSNPVAVTLVNCSDASLQDHPPILLAFQQTFPAQNISRDKDKLTTNQDCLLHDNESVSVKSLAELCKRHLAHLFSTLDNHSSEPEENYSITESPELELLGDTCLTSV